MVAAILIFFLVGMLPTVGTLVFLKKTGRISDWGMSKREERYTLSIVGLFSFLVVYVLLLPIRTTPLGMVAELLAVGGTLFALITRFWKISAHAAAAELFFLFAADYFNFPWFWSIIAIVLICWSRWYRKRHTLWQLIGGIILSWGIWMVWGIN